MTSSETIYDFIGIGLGPFNLGLACLTEPLDDLNGLFIDQADSFDWHPGMLIEGAHLQTPFMADLVTLADPTSRFSVLNYLKQTGRLYPFYIRENFFLLREEYNRYCQWVTQQLECLRFGERVERVEWEAEHERYRVDSQRRTDGSQITRYAKRLVLGTGTQPWMPECTRDLDPAPVHSSRYLEQREALKQCDSITILGSGQSAAEIYHDLLGEIDQHQYRLDWITRSPRFFPLEYSKLTLEMTSPDYIDYFHALPEEKRDELQQSQKGLYKGIDLDLINAIYDLRYTKEVAGPLDSTLITNASLESCRHVDGHYLLNFHHCEQRRDFQHRTQALVLATGYRYRLPDFLAPITSRIAFDNAGRFEVGRFYDIDGGRGDLFVQNVGIHSHSLTAPDLGMGAYRNACIIRAMTGREPYSVESSITAQRFGAPLETQLAPQESAAV
uniref:lysine N(6)-hydroxylase/L-ornithine N(5)-oxygenase family protein n=1 Tax=Halomonas sp. TaxID=1486246 RepID=UPI002631A21E|nr:SidA/IucD/PvdA family monooxygenase [Halomonas sp.]